MTLYAKYHNPELNFDWIMPFFSSPIGKKRGLMLSASATFACKAFSQDLIWNFTHLFKVMRWPCMPSTITLNRILTELCPFFDLRILVKPLHARWLSLCVQVLFSHTVYAIAWNFTHLLRVMRWPCMISTITLNWILTGLCPFLNLEFLVKPLRASSFLTHCAVALKLHTLIQCD